MGREYRHSMFNWHEMDDKVVEVVVREVEELEEVLVEVEDWKYGAVLGGAVIVILNKNFVVSVRTDTFTTIS